MRDDQDLAGRRARGRLSGRRVVVTRASDQAGTLARLLEAEGAAVIEVPTIAIVEPADGGAALRDGVDHLDRYDWVVVTSVNGAERLAHALSGRTLGATRIGAVGPGTAEALHRAGLGADLVPERFVAEGLVESFPPGPGRVLVAQAQGARPVLVEGLRAAGWAVDAVVAYRTIAASPSPSVLAAAQAADVITFTSASTVRNFLAVAGLTVVRPIVVCIGPVTAQAATSAGLVVAAVAAEHTLAGLVTAVIEAVG